MVYDCFIFNNELDLLKLRLNFLGDVVDKFVIVESARTFSGHNKPLYFEENKNKFSDFSNKIIHLICPTNNLPAWEYEFYQRNYIKTALESCHDNDIIFISDADEIININEILTSPVVKFPALIELPMYYYFFNLKTNTSFWVNLVASWKFLKDKNIGYRFRDYSSLTNNRISAKTVNTGWHFSYLFGNDIKRYQDKIRSFSHQEFNSPYFLNVKRIKQCITLAIDLFERPFMHLKPDKEHIQELLPAISQTSLSELVYRSSFKQYLSLSNVLFLLKVKIYRKMKYLFQRQFKKEDILTN